MKSPALYYGINAGCIVGLIVGTVLLVEPRCNKVKPATKTRTTPAPTLKIKEKSSDALAINTNTHLQPFSYIINERDGSTKLLSFEISTADGTVTNVFVHSSYTGTITFEDAKKETALRQLDAFEVMLKFAESVNSRAVADPMWKTNYALATYKAFNAQVQNCVLKVLDAQKALLTQP